MNIPVKRLESGFEMPVYGLGMWLMGGKRSVDTTNDTQNIEAIQAAIELGVTHFDTAESYAAGHSEEVLGTAIQGIDRSKLLIATKVSGDNQSYDGVRQSFEQSLKRLQTDYVDLYLLHTYPDKGIPIKETMRALDELVTQGVIKHIGVSNMTPRRFNDAQQATQNKIVCNQLHYNVQYREAEASGALEHAQQNDALLVAWRPIQKGAIPDTNIIADMAKKYGKTPTQIMLNWLVSQQNVVTISKTSSIDHLKENLGALDWTMESEDIERIRKEFPHQDTVSDTYPLDYLANTPAY